MELKFRCSCGEILTGERVDSYVDASLCLDYVEIILEKCENCAMKLAETKRDLELELEEKGLRLAKEK